MSDPWRRPRLGLMAFGAVLAAGTVAYRLLGLTWVDAFYQTVITVSTVGFTEVAPVPGSVTALYRLITSVVILVGVGVALYTIGVTMDGLMEGHFRGHMERNKIMRELEALEGHTIVCGWGQVGQAIGQMLRRRGRQLVVLDRAEGVELDDEMAGTYLVAGDATEEDDLLEAGIERARDLVVALDTDADTMYAIVTARSLNPDLFIVARSNRSSAGPKLRQAGADRVVNPHEIGGSRMASFLLHPHVADFLGESMHDHDLELRLGEIIVPDDDTMVGRSLGECEVAKRTGVTVLAVRRRDGGWVHNVTDEMKLEAGDVVVALGTPGQQQALRSLAAGVD